MDTLTAFYGKNGFSQKEDNANIFYCMDQYRQFCDCRFREMTDEESAGLWEIMKEDETYPDEKMKKIIQTEERERLAILCSVLVRREEEDLIPEILHDENKKKEQLQKHGLELPDWMKL